MSTETTDPKTTPAVEAAKTAATAADAAAEAAAEAAPQTADEESLKQMQADLDHFRDLALRSRADFENFRKRAAREKDDAVKYANAAFLERLIPILDNFELGLNAARADAANSPILAGMDMVAKQLNDFLTGTGVEPVNGDEGQKFDPNLHEAVAQEASAAVPEGGIVRQLRKGYKLRERLLRPATVVVSKGK
ncbi:MAG TPA: nucleotide exchange factor GrpE [Chthoniobacteraceae bacterium]|nr:nucleotide exchange factor GrpE [Chthoniobacteraceae bacterium]